jgi:hypothetical protein
LREVIGEEGWNAKGLVAAFGFFALHLGLCATADWFPPMWVRTLVDVVFWVGGVWSVREWLRAQPREHVPLG